MPFMGKIFQALRQTRESVSDAFESVVKRKVTPESLEELEDTLISADMGFATAEAVLGVVEKNHKKGFINKVESYLVSELKDRNEIELANEKSVVLMVVGVNGTGKTTSAAKLANYYKSLGKKVLLVGADTYRAAAAEQLKIWAKRVDVNIAVQNYSSIYCWKFWRKQR